MTDEQKAWIDNASYEELLRRWRSSPVGDEIFQGDTGDYFGSVIDRRKQEVGHEEAVATSKGVGW